MVPVLMLTAHTPVTPPTRTMAKCKELAATMITDGDYNLQMDS